LGEKGKKISWRPEKFAGSCASCAKLEELFIAEIVEVFPLRHSLRAVKTLAAFAASIGAIRQQEQHPKFQKAPAFGAMHVLAAAEGAISIFGIRK
jgi:hypothetical protein